MALPIILSRAASFFRYVMGPVRGFPLLLALVGCFGDPWPLPAQPTIAGTRGFVGVQAGVRTFDLQTGAMIGMLRVRQGLQSPAVDGDLLYAPLADPWARPGADGVVAVGITDGNVRWRTPLPGTIHLIRVTEAGPYVVTNETVTRSGASLFALDRDTGTVRWSTTEKGGTFWSSATMIHDVVDAGTQVVVETTNDFEAMDSATGRLRWKKQRGSLSEPTVAGGTLYMLQGDGHFFFNSTAIHALDLASGAEQWSIPIGNMWEAVPAGDALVLFGRPPGLTAIDLETPHAAE